MRDRGEIMGVDFPTYGDDTDVGRGEAVIRYYDIYNSLLVFGYEFEDTEFAVESLVEDEVAGQEIFLITG